MINSIKDVRQRRGLTQSELADVVGVSRQTIISIESGRYVPSTILALKLAKALQRKVEELFELEKRDQG